MLILPEQILWAYNVLQFLPCFTIGIVHIWTSFGDFTRQSFRNNEIWFDKQINYFVVK